MSAAGLTGDPVAAPGNFDLPDPTSTDQAGRRAYPAPANRGGSRKDTRCKNARSGSKLASVRSLSLAGLPVPADTVPQQRHILP